MLNLYPLKKKKKVYTIRGKKNSYQYTDANSLHFNRKCIKQIFKLFKQGHYSMTVYGSSYEMNEGKVKAKTPNLKRRRWKSEGCNFWPLVKPNQS